MRNGLVYISACVLILTTAFTYHTKRTRIQSRLTAGTWHYTSVTKAGKPFFEIGKDDTMKLSDTGFVYALQKPDKHARGSYRIIEVSKDSSPMGLALKFTYFPALNSRVFCLQKLSKKILVMKENDLLFSYKR